MEELKVEAVNTNEAIEKAMRAYAEGDLDLTSEKYMDVKFSIVEEQYGV